MIIRLKTNSNNLLSGLDVNWFLAASPINRSPSDVKATYDGVIRLPWSLAMISTRPFLKIPTHEYVVPRSIPMTVPTSFLASSAAKVKWEVIVAMKRIASNIFILNARTICLTNETNERKAVVFIWNADRWKQCVYFSLSLWWMNMLSQFHWSSNIRLMTSVRRGSLSDEKLCSSTKTRFSNWYVEKDETYFLNNQFQRRDENWKVTSIQRLIEMTRIFQIKSILPLSNVR